MKISGLLTGFFFAIIFSFLGKTQLQIILFAVFLLLLFFGERLAEKKYAEENQTLPLAKAIVGYLAFVTFSMLGFEGLHKPVTDILIIFVVGVFPALVVYFIARYQAKKQDRKPG